MAANPESSPGEPPREEHSLNFQWMKDHIGDVLVQGITETLLLRPEDPIEHLGHWFSQHARNAELGKQLIREQAVIQTEQEEKKRFADEKNKEARSKLEEAKRRQEEFQKTQEKTKARQEADQRARHLEQIRAERTESKPAPSFGIPETIPEVPSLSSVK